MKLLWEKRIRNTNTVYSDKNQCKSQGIKGIQIVLIELVGYCSLGDKWFFLKYRPFLPFVLYISVFVGKHGFFNVCSLYDATEFWGKDFVFAWETSLLILFRQICIRTEEAESGPLQYVPPWHVRFLSWRQWRPSTFREPSPEITLSEWRICTAGQKSNYQISFLLTVLWITLIVFEAPAPI